MPFKVRENIDLTISAATGRCAQVSPEMAIFLLGKQSASFSSSFGNCTLDLPIVRAARRNSASCYADYFENLTVRLEAFHTHNGGGRTLYDVHYEYYVEGQIHTGVIEEHHTPKKEGDSFKIKYNPQAPEEHTRTLEPSKAYLVSGSVFGALGLTLVILSISFIKKRQAL